MKLTSKRERLIQVAAGWVLSIAMYAPAAAQESAPAPSPAAQPQPQSVPQPPAPMPAPSTGPLQTIVPGGAAYRPGTYSGQYGHAANPAGAGQNGQPTVPNGMQRGALPSPTQSYVSSRGLTLANSSWTYQTSDPREFRINDSITVIVNEKSVVSSEGEIDRRKQMNMAGVLKDWVLLKKFAVVPDPQTDGDPKIAAALENKFRTQSDLETRDAMSFKIACRVVELRPNGHLVLEGRKVLKNNHESWEQCVTGVVRPEYVLPNNSVLSENVTELRVVKRESGNVRDGYRRGWLLQWLDKYQPF